MAVLMTHKLRSVSKTAIEPICVASTACVAEMYFDFLHLIVHLNDGIRGSQ
jgi:hypothetical protein